MNANNNLNRNNRNSNALSQKDFRNSNNKISNPNYNYDNPFEYETEPPFNGSSIINSPTSYNIKYKCIQTIDAHDLDITCLIYLEKTNELVSSSLDKTIKKWSVNKGNTSFSLNATLEGHKNSILYINEFKSLNLLCSCSSDKTLKLWDLNSLQCTQTLIKHDKSVLTCSFKNSNEKLIFSGSDDRSIIIWEKDNEGIFYPTKNLQGHLKSVVSVLYIEKLKYLCSGSDDKTIRIWDEEQNFNCIKTINSINCEVDTFKYSRNRLLVSCEDGNIFFINMSVLKKIRSVQFSSSAVYDFNIMDREKYLIIASCDCKGRVWEIGTKERGLLIGHQKPVVGIVPLNNLNIATASMDRTIKIWMKC